MLKKEYLMLPFVLSSSLFSKRRQDATCLSPLFVFHISTWFKVASCLCFPKDRAISSALRILQIYSSMQKEGHILYVIRIHLVIHWKKDKIRPCFLTLAKIGDTEIFAKMAYGTVTYMYNDLYILTYGVKGNCRVREVNPSSFLVNK